jgi:hypothetical protein
MIPRIIYIHKTRNEYDNHISNILSFLSVKLKGWLTSALERKVRRAGLLLVQDEGL